MGFAFRTFILSDEARFSGPECLKRGEVVVNALFSAATRGSRSRFDPERDSGYRSFDAEMILDAIAGEEPDNARMRSIYRVAVNAILARALQLGFLVNATDRVNSTNPRQLLPAAASIPESRALLSLDIPRMLAVSAISLVVRCMQNEEKLREFHTKRYCRECGYRPTFPQEAGEHPTNGISMVPCNGKFVLPDDIALENEEMIHQNATIKNRGLCYVDRILDRYIFPSGIGYCPEKTHPKRGAN